MICELEPTEVKGVMFKSQCPFVNCLYQAECPFYYLSILLLCHLSMWISEDSVTNHNRRENLTTQLQNETQVGVS